MQSLELFLNCHVFSSRNLDIDGDGEITGDEFVAGYMALRKNVGISGRAISMKRRIKVKKAFKDAI